MKSLRISLDHFSEKGLGSKSDWTPDQMGLFLKKSIMNEDFLKIFFEDFSAEGILDDWIGLDWKKGQFGIKFRTKNLTAIYIGLESTEDLSFSRIDIRWKCTWCILVGEWSLRHPIWTR